MTILLDNGHGSDTPGKRSPDGQLMEWRWTREVAAQVADRLETQGISAVRIVSEEWDVPLKERVKRVNAWPGPKLLVSIHANASGISEYWRNPHGWSVFVAKNAGDESKRMAQIFAAEAEKTAWTLRRPSPNVDYWSQSLAICRDTYCPAVLTENGFMDNRTDCSRLLSREGMNTIVDIHVSALIKTIDEFFS